MSCEMKEIANVVDLVEVRNRLLGIAGLKPDLPDELPLKDCYVSLSPTGDVLVLAQNTRLVVLNAKWNSQESGSAKAEFHLFWYGEITYKFNEYITSIVCLPLISHGKASISASTDWTCIAVGYTTGFVKFYTENGALVLEEKFHNEKVLNIKCQSLCGQRHLGETSSVEEIYIFYESVICVLQGNTLFSTLRTCRSHVAKVRANCEDKSPVANLTCKKWGLKNQEVNNDAEVIGMTTVNTFDHLVSATMKGGFDASYRSSAPQHNLVLATGKKPFVGFHYAIEGGSAPVFSDVAVAMASKVTNALVSAVPWFRFGSKGSTEKAKDISNDPVDALNCRFGICDYKREGDCIVVSPNKTLSAVTDTFGRVTLVDNKTGIAIRMWKSYRDAECGWIEAFEEKHKVSSKFQARTSAAEQNRNQLRRTFFLIIYAPKKGVIDIWGMHGTKITTFAASRNGRLLYTNYGLFGLNDVSLPSQNRAQYPCVFLDSLGGVHEIIVPFHFALSSRSADRARDIHVLKKLKHFIREEDFDDDKLVNEVTNACMELLTNEVRLQLVEMLMVNRHITPNSLNAAINHFFRPLDLQDFSELDPEGKFLLTMLKQLQTAIQFYLYIREQYNQPPEWSTLESTSDTKELAKILLTSEREVHRILKLSKALSNLEIVDTKAHNRVQFKDDDRTFFNFLSCFDFGRPGSISLQENITDENKNQISKLIFQGWMYSNDPIAKWEISAAESDIQTSVLMQFALLYWLNRESELPLDVELIRFTKILNAICSLADPGEISTENNEISNWWKTVRGVLSDSVNPFRALTGAMACRAVASTLQKNKDQQQSETSKDDNGNETEVMMTEDDPETEQQEQEGKKEEIVTPTTSSISEWENVSKDTCQFSLLIGNLEDIATLNAILSVPPKTDDTTQFFSIPYETTSTSLGLILARGAGSVSEAVAKWLSSSGVDPARLIDTTDIEFDQMQLSVDSLKHTGTLDEAKEVEPAPDGRTLLSVSVEAGDEASTEQAALADTLDKISMLKRHFPYSLTSSVLLANLCWEFVVAWIKDISKLNAFEAVLAVLKQIPMKHLRHGVCCMLWSLHVRKIMESAAKIINKTGKLPKERLCIQDIGLSDLQTTTFLHHCLTFLDIFLDSEILEEENYSVMKSEQLWEGVVNAPQPFAVMAASQTPACYELVLLHLQLANVLYMIAHFNMKVPKPMNNLFDTVAHRCFFQDMTEETMFPWINDDKRDGFRLDFLCRAITASMESIIQETSDGVSLSSTHAVTWMSKCQTLASIWKINNDELRIHQVCQLYLNGFTSLADELVIAVNDTEKLAANLLPIAGGRLMADLSKSPHMLEEVSRISPALTAYLQNLVKDSSNTVLTNCSSEETIELIQRVARHLPETHNDYHIALLMLDAIVIYEAQS